MIQARGYAVKNATASLQPFDFSRRSLNESDVLIDISFCGICHSDIHQVRDEWGNAFYPMVPGHEIVGKVREVGSSVKKFKVGDVAAVGCLVDSCRHCTSCKASLEQYCENGATMTYNNPVVNGSDPTFGGYSNCIVTDEQFTLKVDASQDLAGVAPLLCAGITTYSPLKYWNVGSSKKVGVIGLGGLGHMAVKLANAMAAEVTLFTHSANKVDDAKRLGAHQVVLTQNTAAFDQQQQSLDLIINTVSSRIDLAPYLNCLKRDGIMVLLGVPNEPLEIAASELIMKRRKLAGSLIGGLAETQEMLDFCAKHRITSDIELIPINKVNEAYDRVVKGDVKYRFVIDMSTL